MTSSNNHSNQATNWIYIRNSHRHSFVFLFRFINYCYKFYLTSITDITNFQTNVPLDQQPFWPTILLTNDPSDQIPFEPTTIQTNNLDPYVPGSSHWGYVIILFHNYLKLQNKIFGYTDCLFWFWAFEIYQEIDFSEIWPFFVKIFVWSRIFLPLQK